MESPLVFCLPRLPLICVPLLYVDHPRQVRDISGVPQLEARYAMTVPVMTWRPAAPGGSVSSSDGQPEWELKRASPRLSADALEKHIGQQLEQLAAAREP